MPTNPSTPTTIASFDQAERWAVYHRIEFGDDVVPHDPDDAGDMFVCEDCDWICLYVPIDERGGER